MRPDCYIFIFIILTYGSTSIHHSFLTLQMAPKKKPQPLALSLQLIEQERITALIATTVPPPSSPTIPFCICLIVLVL